MLQASAPSYPGQAVDVAVVVFACRFRPYGIPNLISIM
eukprot:COSAG05_NODE_3969_length_1744_cov_10.313070_1_plen_37_part_10